MGGLLIGLQGLDISRQYFRRENPGQEQPGHFEDIEMKDWRLTQYGGNDDGNHSRCNQTKGQVD